MNLIAAASLSGALFVLAVFGGAWLAPLLLAVPLPLLLTALHQGVSSGIAAAGLLLGLAFAISHSLTTVLMVFFFLLSFVLLAAHLLRTGWKMSRCLAAAYLIGVCMLVGGVVVAVWAEVDLGQRFVVHLQPLEQQLSDALAQSRQVDAVMLAEAKQQIRQFIEFMGLIFPALTVSGWFFIQAGNLAVASWYMEKKQCPWWQQEDLSHLKLPFWLVWPLIAMAACGMFADGMLQLLGINMGILLCIPYSFQGVAIIRALFQHHQWPRIVWLLFVTMLLLRWEMLLLVIMVGLFNTWWDIRAHLTAHHSYNEL
ncbi:MAG: DUF2232 domain-containing protein [Magnetococcales bacterium]|nr:DUF2232 domain-containing protein [Magnetococcales bacterium]